MGSCNVTSGAGRQGRGPRGGRGGPVRAGSRGLQQPSRALDYIWSKLGASRARGRASGFGASAAAARRAGREPASEPRPRTAPSAPGTPGAAFRPPVPGPASASLLRGAGGPGGSRRARLGNKWARMPYEISKCRGPVTPAVGAHAAGPPRSSAGRGRPGGVSGRGGWGRARAGEPPAALGTPGGDPRPGGGCPKVGTAGWARGSPRVPEGPGRERGPGSRAGPCAPSKWRPPLPVEATGDRLRPVQGPSLVRSLPPVLSPAGGRGGSCH